MERWQLSLVFYECEVGTHRKKACVSAEEKAEESEVLRWDFCIVVGEVGTLPRFLVEV